MALNASTTLPYDARTVTDTFTNEDFLRSVSEHVGGTLVSATVEGDTAGAFVLTAVRTLPTDRLPDIAKKFVGATLHESLCGASPSDAGEEYEDARSEDSDNLDLDFTTDETGGSTTSVTVPWVLPDDGIGRSLLITMDDDGTASPNAADDDDRAVACVSLER